MNMKMAVLGMILIGLFSSAVVAEPLKEVIVPITAAIDINADGKVEALEWLDEKPALKVVMDAIAPHVRQWEFDPGSIDGAPAATHSYLTVSVRLTPNDTGSLSLSVRDARAGMRSDKPVVPRYPAVGLRDGINAVVTVVVDFDADGKGTIRAVDYTTNAKKHYKDHFMKAVNEAVAAWRVEPERVGGHPVAGSLRVPFVFCMSLEWCKKYGAGGEGHDEARAPVALNSAVKLRTKVEGMTLGGI
jgi:hypothetical protein